MRVITLHQPWASLIADGHKTIETRTHTRFKSLVGHRIGIHAGLAWDDNFWKDNFKCLGRHITNDIYNKDVCPKGVIVCTAYVDWHCLLTEIHSLDAMIDCHGTIRYGLFLSDIRKFKTLIPAKGKQGIWNIMSRTKTKKAPTSKKKRRLIYPPPAPMLSDKDYCKACKRELPDEDLTHCSYCGCVSVLN